jgi:hypothetical protein
MLSTENSRLPRDWPRRLRLTLLMCPPLCNSYNNDLRIENRALTPAASRNSGSAPATQAGVALTGEVVTVFLPFVFDLLIEHLNYR